MSQALKCPACGAPLDYSPGGGASMLCPYCRTTVLISDDARSASAIQPHRQNLGTRPPLNPTAGAKFALGMAAFVFFIIAFIIITAVHTARHQIVTHINTPPLNTIPPMPPALILPPALMPPPPSAFANQILSFGSEGIGPGRFTDSRAIAVDPQGRVYVGEYSDGRIQVFDSTGQFQSEWSLGHSKSLLNLTVDRSGTLYVVLPSHIMRYNGATGMPLGEMETMVGDMPEMYMDAFAAPDGKIYAIGGNSDIVILTPDGKIQSVIKAADKIGEDVEFRRIAVLGTGEIFAVDRQKGIFKFAPDGRYINRFGGGDGAGPSHLTSPQNLAIDGKGRLYVSDLDPAVKVFTSDGSFIDSFGGRDVVFGLAITDKDEIYACFRNQHAVKKFALTNP